MMCKNGGLSNEITGRTVICELYPLMIFTIIPPVTIQYLFSSLQLVLRHEGICFLCVCDMVIKCTQECTKFFKQNE
jgi:hypothetical protein